MKKVDFRECTLEYLEDTFGLKPKKQLPDLNKWLNAKMDISKHEERELNNLKDLLQENVHHWNERELSLHFIGPIFSMIHYTNIELQINLFAERSLAGTVQDIELSGLPDGMIASGYRSPKKPYFTFQEYKKERDPHGDPAGQALAAMLVGQELNETKHPIYGCYIVGRDWYFMTLTGKEYTISKGYDATTEHVFDILKILKSLKKLVIDLAS
ncbi:MAG: hypothetical protein AB8G86_19230 [Saprospiraceae bacterium]